MAPYIELFLTPVHWEIDGKELEWSNLLLGSPNTSPFNNWIEMDKNKGVKSLEILKKHENSKNSSPF